MIGKKTTRAIRSGRYRRTRAYLADHVFLSVPGGGLPPRHLLGHAEWNHFLRLPTDVLLRTTDHMGSMVDDMLTQAHEWLTAMPDDPAAAPFMFDAALDTHDEFKAAPFIAAHGWYRQATAGLRNALEVMTHAARYAVRGDDSGFQAWRTVAAVPPNFGNSVDLLHQYPSLAPMEATLGGSGLFGNTPPGVLRALYKDVCRYAHSAPGYTNSDIWLSNGPVFIPSAFTQFWTDYCDALLASYVLLKIGYPPLKLPDAVMSIPGAAGPSWHGLAPSAIAAYFP